MPELVILRFAAGPGQFIAVNVEAGAVRCYAVRAAGGRQQSRHTPCDRLPAGIRRGIVDALGGAAAATVDALAGRPVDGKILDRIAAALG